MAKKGEVVNNNSKAKKQLKGPIGAIINEVLSLVNALVSGVTFLFVTLPVSFYKSMKKLNDKMREKPIDAKELTSEELAYNPEMGVIDKGIIGNLADKIQKKIDNLSFVKAAKEKKEANLKPIEIDVEKDSVKSEVKTTFKYVAKNKDGEIVTGYFPAFSKMDVYSYLNDEKMTVFEITTSKNVTFLHSESNMFKTKMATKDLVFWLTQLSTYIKAGIPLTDAVRVLAQQDKRKKYKGLYDSLIYELTTGQSFSEALRRQSGAFPSLLVNMVKSSEMTGSVEKTLDEMSEYYQEIEDTKKAIISAIAYPAVVMVFAIGIVIFMLTYIVPKFVEVYESMDSEINAITQLCLDISAFLKTKYLYLISGILIVVVGYILLFKNVKAFKVFMQELFMHLPVVGKLIIAKEMSMFSRTFASLQKNNVLLTESIDILAKITENEIYRDIMLRTINNLMKGNKMSETFANHWAVPEIAYFMIVTGESTGELAEMLDRVADYYQKEQRNIVASIKTFIEPVMIISLAVVVGFILVAILIPMFDIYSTVS